MNSESRKILVLGSTGMFGRELYREAIERGYNVRGAARRSADVSLDLMDGKAIHDLITLLKPDIVINSAAIIAHKVCEEKPDLAYKINARAVDFVANASRKTGARFVQISTDHFFSGDRTKLHDEAASVRLLSEYARTKFAGEAFALNCPGALVMRTNVTGFRNSGGVRSFIEWVFDALRSPNQINLFNDYYTSTLSTHQAAMALFDLLETDVSGRINVACREVSSKQAFVEKVADRMGLHIDHAQSISVHEGLAKRADSCGLDVTRAESVLGYQLPVLDAVVEQLVSEYEERNEHKKKIAVK